MTDPPSATPRQSITELHTSALEYAIVGGFAVAVVLVWSGLINPFVSQSALASAIIGVLVAIAIATDAVLYRTNFGNPTIPLSEITRSNVTMRFGLLPTQHILFLLTGDSGLNGRMVWIGLFDRSRARQWVQGLNARLAGMRNPEPQPGTR